MKALRGSLALASLIGFLSFGSPAEAQQVNLYCNTGLTGVGAWAPCSASNPLQVAASVSIAGFEPATTGTPVAADDTGDTQTLPAGTVVVAFNIGTANTAFCKLGATATTNDIAIPPASWFAFTVGAATQLTCITTAGLTTTVNIVGGAGIPTGAGGGGGGGSSGDVNVTQLGGNAIATNTGNSSAGTQRVVLADDTPGIIPDAAFASAASAPATAIGVLCVYNSTPPTLTNGQSVGFECDTKGNLLGQIRDAAGNARGANVDASNRLQTFPGAGAVSLTSTVLSFNSSGDNTAISRSVGTLKVYQLMLACASEVAVTLKNGAGTGLTGAMTIKSLFLPYNGEPYFVTTSTNNFVINLGSGVQCSGTGWSIDS